MTEYVYKLKNGKVVSAYADEKGNISITKEALEIMVNSWNVGYQKGFSDGCLKGRADAIDEFVELYDKFCNSDIVCGGDECIGKFCPRCFKDNFMEQLKDGE